MTYCFVKVHQAELVWFGEEFRLVHETDVENDVGAFLDLNAIDGVIFQSFSHREVDHRVKPQRLINEAIQHFQAMIINVFICLTWK